MDKRGLEARLLNQVLPLKSPASNPTSESTILSKLSELPHNHQKGKQCRSCRTLRKIAKHQAEAQRLSFIREVTEGSVAVTLYSLGQIVKAGLEGTLEIGKAIASNPDPVSQGIAIGGGYAAFLWFVTAFPELARLLHLDTFAITSPAGQKAAKDITDSINNHLPDIPFSAGTGQYGLKIEYVLGFLGGLGIIPGANVSGTYWFDTPAQRADFRNVMNTKLGPLVNLYTITELYRAPQH